MANLDFKDPFERGQYLVFRIILFILFLVLAFKVLDGELHISDLWK